MEKLEVGNRIKDNDPRMGKRVLEITEVNNVYVFAKTPIGRTVRISIDRIYTDARERRTGFSRIVDTECEHSFIGPEYSPGKSFCEKCGELIER